MIGVAGMVHASRLRDTHRRSHAGFLLRLLQQATEEMQWVSGSFHLQTKLRSQQPEPVLFDFRFAGLRRYLCIATFSSTKCVAYSEALRLVTQNPSACRSRPCNSGSP